MINRQAVARVTTTALAQSISSLTNFLAAAFALHAADGDLAAFGRFSIAYQLCQIIIAVTQSSVGSALMVHGAQATDEARRVRASGAHAAVAFGGALSVLVIASAFLAGDGYRTVLLICAAGCPALALQYTLRHSLFARDLPRRVIMIDSVWLSLVVAAAAADTAGLVDVSVRGYLAVWLGAAYVSALPIFPDLRSAGGGSRRHFWQVSGPQATRLAVEGLLARSVFVLILVSANVLVGPEASGAVAAAILVFSPLSIVHGATTAISVPSLIRSHDIHLPALRTGLGLSGVVVAATLAWAVVVVLLDRMGLDFGPFPLEDNGVTLGLFVGVLIWFSAMALGRGAVIMLRVADLARETLNVRIFSTALEIVLPVIGFAWLGTAAGVQALGLATALSTAVAWIAYARIRDARIRSEAVSA